MKLTPEKLVALRRLAQIATQGEWRLSHTSRHGSNGYNHHVRSQDNTFIVEGRWGIPSLNDAAYIVAFDPPTTLALLDRLDRLQTAVEKFLDADGMGWSEALEPHLSDLRLALGLTKEPPHA